MEPMNLIGMVDSMMELTADNLLSSLHSLVSSSCSCIIKKVISDDVEQIRSAGKALKKQRKELLLLNDKDIKIAYVIGYLCAINELLEDNSKRLQKAEEARQLLAKNKLIKSIVEHLYNESGLTAGCLAEYIDRSENHTRRVLNSSDVKKYVVKKSWGKKMIYSLSSEGHDLYPVLQEVDSKGLTVEGYTDAIIKFIDAVCVELKENRVDIERFETNASDGIDFMFTKPATVKQKTKFMLKEIDNEKKNSTVFSVSKSMNVMGDNQEVKAFPIHPLNISILKDGGEIVEREFKEAIFAESAQ